MAEQIKSARGAAHSDDLSDDRPIRSTAWRWLLVIPFIATLWVPFYNMATPELFGFPFFYWYQLLWVPLSAVIIFIVFRAES